MFFIACDCFCPLGTARCFISVGDFVKKNAKLLAVSYNLKIWDDFDSVCLQAELMLYTLLVIVLQCKFNQPFKKSTP